MSGFLAVVAAVWWFVSWPFVAREWIDVREFRPDET